MQRNGCSFLGGTKGEEEEEEEGNGKSTVAAWFHLPLINVFKKKVLMHEPISFLSFFSFFFKECYERKQKLLRLLQNFCCFLFFLPPTTDRRLFCCAVQFLAKLF